MKKKFNKLQCNTCVHHGIVAKCDVCLKVSPRWDIVGDTINCLDYEKKKRGEM